jgi:hypothetical protein
VFHAIWDIKTRLWRQGGVANPRRLKPESSTPQKGLQGQSATGAENMNASANQYNKTEKPQF